VSDFRPAADAPRTEAVNFFADSQMPRDQVEQIIALASRQIAVPCRLHVSDWDAGVRRLNGREQVDADALLVSFEKATSAETVNVGLTQHDLGLMLFTFVFGRARRYGHAAIVSLARLGPEHYGLPADPGLEVSRAVAEVMHELGHVAGLAHCRDLRCLMYFATNVETIDLRGKRFCAACSAALPPQLLLTARMHT